MTVLEMFTRAVYVIDIPPYATGQEIYEFFSMVSSYSKQSTGFIKTVEEFKMTCYLQFS